MVNVVGIRIEILCCLFVGLFVGLLVWVIGVVVSVSWYWLVVISCSVVFDRLSRMLLSVGSFGLELIVNWMVCSVVVRLVVGRVNVVVIGCFFLLRLCRMVESL